MIQESSPLVQEYEKRGFVFGPAKGSNVQRIETAAFIYATQEILKDLTFEHVNDDVLLEF